MLERTEREKEMEKILLEEMYEIELRLSQLAQHEPVMDRVMVEEIDGKINAWEKINNCLIRQAGLKKMDDEKNRMEEIKNFLKKGREEKRISLFLEFDRVMEK